MNVNLVLFKQNGSRKSFPLKGTVTVLGRQQECDLCVPLMVASRRHCELNQDDGKLKIRDLGSRNGTFLNGERVEEAEVSAGDRIQIGPLEFAVQIDGVPADDEISKPKAQRAFEAASDDDFSDFADLDDLDDLDNLDNLENLTESQGQGQTIDDLDAFNEIIDDSEDDEHQI